MERIFTNKVAIVTGAASGIGRATAIAFSQRGAKVVVSDISDAGETCQTITGMGGTCMYVRCDVSKEAEVKNLVDVTIKEFGCIDFAFNNAGIEGETTSTHECSMESWNSVIEINLRGVWLCMKYELLCMLEKGSGVIVNTSSTAGLVGVVGMPAYTASKHGIVGLTKVAALEYARKGIRVNAVCPGAIKTAMVDRLMGNSKEAENAISQQEPIGRIGMPEEVAGAVMWLCSDEASFVTGQAIAVDGGLVAQ